MEISCVHHSDSSSLGACGRTWSRSRASSRRRSAWELELCAGQWHRWSHTNRQREIQRVKETGCASSGCALWRERPCPRLLSWRLDNAMLPWEQRDSRNFHMWSCCSQKLQRGIVVQGPPVICAGCSALFVTHDRRWTKLLFIYFPYFFVDITQEREGC